MNFVLDTKLSSEKNCFQISRRKKERRCQGTRRNHCIADYVLHSFGKSNCKLKIFDQWDPLGLYKKRNVAQMTHICVDIP